MHVEMRPITSIKPYDQNPRHNDAAVDAVAASIREFGFRQPIVVDEDGVIIVGHTRYKAALKLGLETVPVHVAKGLTPEQIKALRIADNKTAALSDWNYELLPIELAQLRGMHYDLGLLGFDQEELAQLLDPGVTDGLCDPDEVPAPPDEATTRPGDLWLLGKHRLLCGDSSKPEDVDRVGGRGDSGTLGILGYRTKPRDGHHANAAGRRPRCTRRAMRIRTRLGCPSGLLASALRWRADLGL
jgi:ParB-like chromosome segregation protein Spo0J